MMILRRAALVLLTSLLLLGCGSGPSTEDDQPAKPPCTTTADCGEGAVCRDEGCLVPQTCETSGDCGINRECDQEANVCVECLRGDHCAPGETCMAGVCRNSCENNADCAGDTVCAENGYCAECRGDSGCAGDEHCDDGRCVADICDERSTSCNGKGTVKVCSDRGDSEVELECPEGETCGTEQGPAWCQGWVCVPSQSRCSDEGNFVETCSEDGLIVASTTECGETNSLCVDGACEPIVCDPFSTYCKDGDIYECNALGTVETVSQVCFAYEYCREESATCEFQECLPGTNGCDGGQRATCDELGSGYEDHQTCADGTACYGGSCQDIVCDPNQRYCDGSTVYRCDPTGTQPSIYSSCSSGQFCNDTGGTAYCSSDVCVSGQPTCLGSTLGVCNTEGSGLLPGAEDCSGNGQVCQDTECQDVICTNLQRLCVDGDVHTCIDQGSATQLYHACLSDEYCDDSTDTCQDQICDPGQPGCDGQVARTCNADGSDWVVGGTDCASLDAQVCDAGACEAVVCPASGRYCEGTQLMSCNALGTGGTLYQGCSVNTHCYESSPTWAYCRTDVCTADQPTCDGEVATTCRGDGGEKLPGGTDCSEGGQACYDGDCRDIICAGTYECVDGDHHWCQENQTATSLRDTCTASEYCDESLGCRAHVCTPDSEWCYNSGWLRTCNSEGSGHSMSFCGGGSACWDDACAPVICADGEELCHQGDFYQCTGEGTVRSLLNLCVEAQYCDDTAGCLPDNCTADQPLCNGNLVTTCESDGSGPVPGGTDCADTGEGCNAATCEPIVCAAGEFSCDGAVLEQCVKNGTVIEIQETCGAETICVAEEGACLEQICTPAGTACLDFDTVMTCTSDGQGFDSPTDCSAGEVCSGGACVPEASSCSIAGKTWSTPAVIATDTSKVYAVESDPLGNVFAAWHEGTTAVVSRFSQSEASWTETQWDFPSSSFYQMQLAVSETGDAWVFYAREILDLEIVGGLYARMYDAGLGAWGPEETLLEREDAFLFEWDLTARANRSGQILVGLTTGYEKEAYGFAFDPELGWSTSSDFANAESYHVTVDLTEPGHGVLAWFEQGASGGMWWSTVDYSTGIWTPAQRIEGPFPSLDYFSGFIAAKWAEQDGSQLEFFYAAQGEEIWEVALHSATWDSLSGLGTPQEVSATTFLSELQVVRVPGYDLLALGPNGQTYRLADGASSWSADEAYSVDPIARVFPSGEIIAANGGTLRTYEPGAGWSSQSYGTRAGVAAALPHCEAAWVYRSGTNTYATFLE